MQRMILDKKVIVHDFFHAMNWQRCSMLHSI